jgi:pimeloyl-ACP methyl ester carboxylesterase
MKILPVSALAAIAVFLTVAWTSPFAEAAFEGESKNWNGYQRFDFKVEERASFVVVPKVAAEGNPWVWRARFPGYHAEADVLLLEHGFHIAFIDTNGWLGSPRALKYWDAFYELMTGTHGLAEKPALEAVSRGGLFAYRWAAKHPDRVACIYADTPVCDIKSWPLGQGKGIGHEGTWKTLLAEYGFSHEEALAFKENPIDVLAPIAAAKIPLLHIVSLTDVVVPPEENTFVLAKRYRELGGDIEVIEVAEGTEKSKGHHFAHPEPKRAADFIKKHTAVQKASE